MSYFEFLLLVHIGGAIIGFGPAFAFAVLGPTAKKNPGPGGLAIMEGMLAIAKRLVLPVAIVIQPLTGALLIFEADYSSTFWSQDWLVGSIVLYAVAFYVSVFVQRPSLERMIALAKEGQAESESFQALAKRSAAMGPILTLLLVVIIIMMMLKPGA
jgi:uncharacterized membrane protein